MNRTLAGLLGCAVLAAGALIPVDAAMAKKKSEASSSAAATTDINSCAKLPVGERDSCISRSRPVKGAELYRKFAVQKAVTAVSGAAEKAKAAVSGAAEKAKAAVAGAAEKAKSAGKDAVAAIKALPAGPTKIDDCSKVDASLRDTCISRSRPVSGADLYKKYKN